MSCALFWLHEFLACDLIVVVVVVEFTQVLSLLVTLGILHEFLACDLIVMVVVVVFTQVLALLGVPSCNLAECSFFLFRNSS